MVFFTVLNRFRLFFGLSYAGIGIFMPYLALLLTSRGLSGSQIGLLLSIIPLTSFLTQPLWGLISDVYHVRKKALVLTCIGASLTVLLLNATTDFRLLLVITAAYAIMNGSIHPLGTSLTLDYLEGGPGKETFGSLRLWGSIGFAVSSFVIGAWVINDALGLIIPIYSACLFSVGITALLLPDPKGHGRADWREGIVLLKQDQTLALFLFSTLLIGFTLGIVNNYLAIYLDVLQAAGWVIGAAMALSALAEVPLMARVPQFLNRWGIRLVFVGGVAALPVRWILYTFITDPLWVLPTQLLHSIAVMALMVVGVVYMDQQLDRTWRASGQALYSAILYGVGPSIGTFVAGQVYEQYGIQPLWLMCALVGTVGTVLLNIAVQKRLSSRAIPEGSI